MTDNKLKLHQAVAISDAITGILSTNSNLPAKLTFALVKNKNSLKENVEAFQKAQEPSKDFSAYEDERMKLCMELCDKDENGNPKFTSNPLVSAGQQMFSMTDGDNAKQFEKKFSELKEKNKDVLSTREQQLKDLETILNSEVETKLTKIKLSDIPDSAITPKQMETIYSLIDED